MQRQYLLEKLGSTDHWDILVIGGGSSGLGIALDAVSRGYSVILLEISDFAKGTSSRSTKLIHGGVRYLAQGNIALVREAGKEREILYKIAPHLVHDTQFLIPVYNLWSRLKYTIGLKLYDWISGKFKWGSSGYLAASEVADNIRNVKSNGLLGAVTYHDGQFDDARLALNLAQTINEQGGTALNYFGVTDLLKDDNGHITGVKAIDQQSGELYEINAKVVVNATGVFADNILLMDNPGAERAVRPSQGIHLVVDKKFLPGKNALMIPQTSDGRVLFAVPWHGRLILGTTDTPVKEAIPEPVSTAEEIDFILKTAGDYLIHTPSRKDVLSVYAGLRPLAATKANSSKTKEISRSHKIIQSQSGLFTMLGGKWTTYRRMGEDMITAIEKNLLWPATNSVTKDLKIHGFALPADIHNSLYYYGSDLEALSLRIDANPDGWISQLIPLHRAQVEWAVEHELIVTVEDMLSRRTRALLLDARETLRILPAVASIIAILMHKGEDWIENQISDFTRVANNYLLK